MELLDFLATIALPINFVFHITIFLGTLYVAIHSRKIPRWHVTVLWYCGLSSALTAITIGLEWCFGRSFPLSYFNVGIVAETLLHGCLAFMALSVWIHTAWKDIHEMKNRRPVDETVL